MNNHVSGKKHDFRFILYLVLVFCFVILSRYFHFEQETFLNYLKGFPLLVSAVIFVLLYVGLTFLVWFGPKDVLRVVAAFLYGPYLSTVIVWFGEMGNACVMFSLSRHFGRDFIAAKLPHKMQQIDRAIAERSFWSIFFLRFFPIVPFRFQDLGFGLTRISLRRYLTIAAIGSPLRIFVIQFFIALGMDTILNPAKLSLYLQENPSIFAFVMVYVIGAFFMIYLYRKSRLPPHN